MYVDHESGQQAYNLDPEAGLYVTQRNGKAIHVDIPNECMAVQLGECTQIVTGGLLVATPHCVRGTRAKGIARIANPYFIDTAPDFPLSIPLGSSRKDIMSSSISSKVPELSSRWTRNGMKFGDFLTETFSKYYIHSNTST